MVKILIWIWNFGGQNIFKSKTNTRNLKQFENQVLCLPNHRLISKKYIEFIVNLLNEFYKKND